MTAPDSTTSGYLAHLPAIFHADPFAGRFLLAFETILHGTDPQRPGLETKIGHLADYLDPMTTDEEFLPWLAGWVALSLRADWDAGTKRRFIAQITSLYRLRGTPEGLRRMLKLYTDAPVEVVDDFAEPAHYFQVQLTLPEADPDLLREKEQIARAIIDREKPAHTFYALRVAVPTMRLVSLELQAEEEKRAWEERQRRYRPPLLVLGRNTLLGTANQSA